jgi:Kef-type K+ transport system membrane component KefB
VSDQTVSTAVVGTVLADLALILLVGFGFAALARKLGQPPVIGEIVGGLALGPSLLGLLPGHPVTRLFPIASQNYLQVLAQLGVVLFMFGVGYHFEPERLRGTGGRLAAVSAGSLVLPFILGAAIVPTVLPLLDPTHGGDRRTWGSARLAGMHPRDSVVLGVLLNTRGLTELIVLDVGLSLHVLDPLLFSAMVVMAVVTTVLTSPLLRLYERRGRRSQSSQSGAGWRYQPLDEPEKFETVGIGALNEDV